jgi:hypothetical protein
MHWSESPAFHAKPADRIPAHCIVETPAGRHRRHVDAADYRLPGPDPKTLEADLTIERP